MNEYEYEVIIVGAGGHGLATAYYLAKEHGITDVAVLEKGWLGGGNTGRNTTIIRSNYLWDESARIYDHAVKLWEGLSQELNFNVMFSQRGVMHLAHSVHDLREVKRRGHANRLNGVDSELLSPEQVKEIEPLLNTSRSARYPIMGASLQRRGGTARHDAVAWGYARGADARAVGRRVVGRYVEQERGHRVDEAVVGDAAGLDAGGLALILGALCLAIMALAEHTARRHGEP